MGNRISTKASDKNDKLKQPRLRMNFQRDNSEKLKIQITSDLHLEFWRRNLSTESPSPEKEKDIKKSELSIEKTEELFLKLLKPSAPYLALLGDIGSPNDDLSSDLYLYFLTWCSKNWKVSYS